MCSSSSDLPNPLPHSPSLVFFPPPPLRLLSYRSQHHHHRHLTVAIISATRHFLSPPAAVLPQRTPPSPPPTPSSSTLFHHHHHHLTSPITITSQPPPRGWFDSVTATAPQGCGWFMLQAPRGAIECCIQLGVFVGLLLAAERGRQPPLWGAFGGLPPL
ncbi:hypothetical protein Tco_0073950 [Tanacetum coccineum]